MHRFPLLAIVPCTLLGTVPAVLAQPPSFDDSSVWHEELWRYEGLQAHHFVYTIRISGDTVVDGVACKKLFQEGTHTISELLGSPPPPPVIIQMAQYAGALRADAEAQQWWFVEPGTTGPLLLYDFDLEVGGTVMGTFGDCSSGPICTAIDAVWFNGRMHRRFILDNGFRHLIEGVGASSGLLGYLCQFFEEGSCLQAYEQGHAAWEVQGCDAVATSLTEMDPEDGAVYAYPNPTTGDCFLGDPLAGRTVVVYDTTGRVVLSGTAGRNGMVELGTLAPGSYAIRLSEPGGKAIGAVQVVRQ